MYSDSELLDAWRGGRQDAGEMLFQRYYDGVYRFFRNKIHDDTADLVQQTFLACVEGRDRVREGGSFRSYLFAVAYNVLCAYLRTTYRAASVGLDEVSAQDLSPGPGTLVVRRREERLLLDALRSIPLAQQVIIELRYWEHLSHAEIADVLGVPVNAVRGRLHRAREALKVAMGRLAASPQELTSTLANLDDWARQCRERLVS
jgi:RNA polymerase sigma-70 factor (ECF subfamily)